MFHPTGNLLNSLMGSGEDDDGAEEAQEDSSPIELDWACSPGENENEQTNANKRKTARLPSSPPQRGQGEALVPVFSGVLFHKSSPLHYPKAFCPKSEQVSFHQNIPVSTAWTDRAKLRTLPLLNLL